MQLFRYGGVGTEPPAVRHDGAVYDLRPVTPDIDGTFLETDGVAHARRFVAGELPAIDIDGQRIASPPPARRRWCASA